MKIVFMGTPDYAVPTLKQLISDGHDVAAVFCQPDKPVGRKQILTPPAVKVCALENGIPVYQPDSVKTDEIYEILLDINPDVIIVVAYGKILPERILNLPRLGCINGHASILPKYRGASPIQWAIVCGEKETGVTAMYMDKGMDTGDILQTVNTVIYPNETADELFDRLSLMTASLLSDTVKKAQNGELTPIKQNHDEATYAPIIKKEMALIDFSKSADEIFNMVRGYNSWPIAYCFLDGKRFKIFSCKVGDSLSAKEGMVVLKDGKMMVACGKGSIELLEVQLEGGKRMSVNDFLKGKQLSNDTTLTRE